MNVAGNAKRRPGLEILVGAVRIARVLTKGDT